MHMSPGGRLVQAPPSTDVWVDAAHGPSPSPGLRVHPDGKHLALDGRPFRVRGATYGTFMPRLDGELFPEPSQIKLDLQAMADSGFNVLRTYTLPPVDLLDLAEEFGLRVLVGVDYEDWRSQLRPGKSAHRRVLDAGRAAVESTMARCAGRSCVLAVSVGNEVPGDIVRLHGIGGVEEVLSSLVEEVHAMDRSMLATYTNFPTTEYLHVEGQDLICFNVFLEHPDQFRRYVRHLQVLSEDLPLVITELGLASGLHGEEAQATSLAWQLRLLDEAGCAGATIFSWTDDWAVAGVPVPGWGFGLTDERRQSKLALEVASNWARSSVRDLRKEWPRVSVVVCAYNEERHIEAALASLQRSDYPDLEVIVCDDGSSDTTPDIARRFPVTLLELRHVGLSAARNAGIAAATGRIVAFLDADAACHPEWPYHLALSLEEPNVVATGGPNLPVPDAGFVESAVAKAPGGPIHVLVSDDRAEHVPGCNAAFRKAPLEAVGAFDPVYTSAGDDVDVCWKLIDRDHQIGFSPAAQVYHHRRASVRGYLRQQRGYGRAERLLYLSHRHRFNRLGQARWAGLIYGTPQILPSLLRPLIYHGPMGTAPFQHILHRRSEAALAWSSALLPLGVPLALAGLLLAPFSSVGFALTALVLLFALGYGITVAVAVRPDRPESRPIRWRLLVAFLHLAQPLVRAAGRTSGRRSKRVWKSRTSVSAVSWSGDRRTWLLQLRRELWARQCVVRSNESHESWDLEATVGPFVACRITTAVVWGWTPLARLRFAPRLPAVLVLGSGLVLTLFAPPLGGAVIALVALLTAADGAILRRKVRAALVATTNGALR